MGELFTMPGATTNDTVEFGATEYVDEAQAMGRDARLLEYLSQYIASELFAASDAVPNTLLLRLKTASSSLELAMVMAV